MGKNNTKAAQQDELNKANVYGDITIQDLANLATYLVDKDKDKSARISELEQENRRLTAAIAIYCREQVGEIDFENDKEAIEYFVAQNKE